MFFVSSFADTIWASAQIQLNQQLTLDRHAFDTQMTIANGLDTTSLTNVSVSVSFTDANSNLKYQFASDMYCGIPG